MPDHADPPAEAARPARHAKGPQGTPADPSHRADGAPPPGKSARHRRRVTTTPPVGSDPSPSPEPARHVGTENDERLKGDKPPHWS